MNTNPLVSIVIPVYNVPEHLPRCLESILNQTYENWEAIVVDDGSTDGKCPEICDLFGKCDSRFRVIHKENGGVCSARNVGIKSAAGYYTMFLDQDDYYAPQLVETAVAVQETYPNGFLMWDTVSDASELTPLTTDISAECAKRYEKHEIAMLYMQGIFAPIWNKVYRTDYLQGIIGEPVLFDESNRVGTEDLPFALAYGKKLFSLQPASSFVKLEGVNLHYYEEGNSESVSKSERHTSFYCTQTLKRDGPLTQDMETFFGCSEEEMRPIYTFFLHCLAYGFYLMPSLKVHDDPADVMKHPEFLRLMAKLKALKAYTPYYLPFAFKNGSLVRMVFGWEKSNRFLYEKAYWLGYYLLGGSWAR